MKAKSIDASKKHAVSLTFLLQDNVSPQELAQLLAKACGGSVLRPGDAILVEHANLACVVTDETLSLPSFGWQWRTARTDRTSLKSLKDPKPKKLARNRRGR